MARISFLQEPKPLTATQVSISHVQDGNNASIFCCTISSVWNQMTNIILASFLFGGLSHSHLLLTIYLVRKCECLSPFNGARHLEARTAILNCQDCSGVVEGGIATLQKLSQYFTGGHFKLKEKYLYWQLHVDGNEGIWGKTNKGGQRTWKFLLWNLVTPSPSYIAHIL